MSEIQIGIPVLGRYRIDAKLGEGGMAAVYLSYDLQRRVVVALKFLKPDYAEDELFVHKFRRDASNLHRLTHPNIVRFYEFVEGANQAFMVLDYIDGPTLRKIMRQRGRPFSLGEVLGYLRPICAALSYAHSQNVIHCDVKPGNVMLDRVGRLFVTDFGIARISESATVTDSTPGTALYLAPEQWRRGEQVSPATDIYALGIMLYEMLAGTPPFTGASIQARGTAREKIMREQLTARPPRASQLNPQLTTELDVILLRCLEKVPGDRFRSADELLGAFTALAAASESAPVTLPARPGPRALNRPVLLAVLACSVLVVLLVLAALWRPVQGDSNGTLPTLAVTIAPSAVPATSTSPVTSAATDATALPTSAATDVTALPTSAATETDSPTATTTAPAPAVVVNQNIGRDGMTLISVPAGDFIMGAGTNDGDARLDEFPQHVVYLSAFWIDQTEISNAMFAAFLNAQGTPPGQGWLRTGTPYTHVDFDGRQWQVTAGFELQPIGDVYFFGAEAYCEWAGRRLPTEAEWEKAARGTQGLLFPWGNGAVTGALANFADRSSGAQTATDDGYAATSPVGNFQAGASPYGALDLAGNVWEWVADWYAKDYYSQSPAIDPHGPAETGYRVLRGGSYNGGQEFLRTTHRGAPVPATDTNIDFGFRCAAD